MIGSSVTATGHPMIMRAVEPAMSWENIQPLLSKLRLAVRKYDVQAAQDLLLLGVREYGPATEIADHVCRSQESYRLVPSNVSSLSERRSYMLHDTKPN